MCIISKWPNGSASLKKNALYFQACKFLNAFLCGEGLKHDSVSLPALNETEDSRDVTSLLV